jgi:hypothetical protein
VPILPLDLQTLFSQTAQVGKEQATQKDATPTAQSLQGSQMVQKTEQRDASVNETQDSQEGLEQVKDRERRGAARRGRKKRGEKKPPEPPAPQRSVFADPALGRNVDITS